MFFLILHQMNRIILCLLKVKNVTSSSVWLMGDRVIGDTVIDVTNLCVCVRVKLF